MTRSKEDKALFITNLRNAVKAMEENKPEIPVSLLDSYSRKNCYAILLQYPNATNCAGFHAWKAVGRSVRKGSKGIAIMIPLGGDDDDKPRFSWRYVFDISQTEPLDENSPKLARDLVVA